jgi:hypothetical protein
MYKNYGIGNWEPDENWYLVWPDTLEVDNEVVEW